MYGCVNASDFNWSLTGKSCMEWLRVVDESFPLNILWEELLPLDKILIPKWK